MISDIPVATIPVAAIPVAAVPVAAVPVAAVPVAAVPVAAVPHWENENILYSLGWSKLNGTPVEPLDDKPRFGIEL